MDTILLSTGTNTLTEWYGIETAYKMIKKAGFDAVDYTLFNSWGMNSLLSSESELKKFHRESAEMAKDNGIELFQAHAPMRFGRQDDKQIENDIYGSALACGAAGIPYLVVHPIHTDISYGLKDYDAWKKRNLDMMRCLLPVLRDNNVYVCVENMYGKTPAAHTVCPTFPSYPEHLADYIDSMNELAGEKRFYACLDTGHMVLSGISAEYAVKALGDRIRVLHIHDNNGKSDEHTLPQIDKDCYGCTGIVDWRAFTEALCEIGYTGTMNLESDGMLGLYGKDVAEASLSVMSGVCARLTRMMAKETD